MKDSKNGLDSWQNMKTFSTHPILPHHACKAYTEQVKCLLNTSLFTLAEDCHLCNFRTVWTKFLGQESQPLSIPASIPTSLKGRVDRAAAVCPVSPRASQTLGCYASTEEGVQAQWYCSEGLTRPCSLSLLWPLHVLICLLYL